MCSMLISPPRGSVSAGLPVTLVNVCVVVGWCGGWGGVGVLLQTNLLSPLTLVQLSVCGSVVKSMASCCSGCVLLLFLPPVGLLLPNQTFHSSLWCFLTKVCDHKYINLLAYLTAYLLISLPASSLLAHLSISPSSSLVNIADHLLICLVGWLLTTCKQNLL